MEQYKPFRDKPGLAQSAGAKGGKKSKGRVFTPEHKRKLAEAARRRHARERSE
jgi:hypothetical protein